ncbi:MAG: hypothetical protein HQM03_07390 [Magnetococcales bacterium]|nr:hypothetical protein [Magnetococcales bacterium]
MFGKFMRKGPWLLVALLTGCGMPPHMEVRTGSEPKYEDEDVRFRTVYYIRVVNNCEEYSKVKEDTFFRFIMRGKAGSLTNKVLFESGVLHRDQIEGFDKMVRYGNNGFTIDGNGVAVCADGGKCVSEKTKCSEDHAQFEIWGPQGVKHLNPDERLLMAMSIDSSPLIQTLQDISRRMSPANQALETERAKERLRLQNTKAKLAGLASDDKKEADKGAEAFTNIVNGY